jgi:hypothetical protein
LKAPKKGLNFAETTVLYTNELALTSPTSGGRSLSIVRSRTKATEFIGSIDVTQHKVQLAVLMQTVITLEGLHSTAEALTPCLSVD